MNNRRRIKVTDFWLAIVIAVFTIGPVLFSDKAGLRLLWGAPKDYPNFSVDPYTKLTAVIILLIGITLIALAQFFISDTKTKFTEHKIAVDLERKTQAEAKEAERLRQLREEQEAALQARLDEGIERLEQRIEDLEEAGYSDVSSTEMDNGLRLTRGEKTEATGALPSSQLRIEVDDKYGNDKLYMVFHLFENSAYWNYDSASGFTENGKVGTDGIALALAEAIENDPLAGTLPTYDMLIGVGQESKSQTTRPEIGFNRASHLCAILQPFSGGGAEVFGLDIGRYQGFEEDSLSSPDRKQRSVIIVGVEKADEAATGLEEDLLEEVISEVNFSGLDLSQFSKLRAGRSPTWLHISKCGAPL